MREDDTETGTQTRGSRRKRKKTRKKRRNGEKKKERKEKCLRFFKIPLLFTPEYPKSGTGRTEYDS